MMDKYDNLKKWICKHKKLEIILIIILLPSLVAVITTAKWLPVNVSNDWIGFWGTYLGVVGGACVTVWGINKTVKENRKLGVEPYLIFEEIDELPKEEVATVHFENILGNSYAEKIIKITNVGNGPAVEIIIDSNEKWHTRFPVLKKEESVYVAVEHGVNVPEISNLENLSKKEIESFCLQNKETGLTVKYEDILGNVSAYKLYMELECSIETYRESGKRYYVTKMVLSKWKRS